MEYLALEWAKSEGGRPEFTLEKITKGMQSFMKKADKNGFKQADVIRAVLDAGIDMDTLMAVMDEMTIAEAA